MLPPTVILVLKYVNVDFFVSVQAIPASAATLAKHRLRRVDGDGDRVDAGARPLGPARRVSAGQVAPRFDRRPLQNAQENDQKRHVLHSLPLETRAGDGQP